jgi:hypothetical protein
MPKAPSSKVITYRIEFQESERQMFRDLIMANNVNTIAKTIDDLLSFENLYIGATVYEMITGEEVLAGTPNDLGDLLAQTVDWWRTKKAQYPEGQAGHQSFALELMKILSDFTGLDENSWFAKNERVSDFKL